MSGKCNLLFSILYYLLPYLVWKTVPHCCAHLPLARSPYSKSITDNPDATDLFFSRIFIVLLDFSAPAGRWDFHGLTLAGGNPAPYRRKYNP